MGWSGKDGARGCPFIADGRRTVDAVQRAPVAVLARRRPVEGVARLRGARGTIWARRGGVARAARARRGGPAVSALGRCTTCMAWRGRGVLGIVLGAVRLREGAGRHGRRGGHGAAHCGAATTAARRDMATCARPRLSPAAPPLPRPPCFDFWRAER